MTRETNFTQSEVEKLKNTSAQMLHTMQLIDHIAMEKAIEILSRSKDKTLTFTDDDNGEDLAVEMDDKQTPIRNVFLMGDCVLLTSEDNEKFYPWELGIKPQTLLSYMISELERETETSNN